MTVELTPVRRIAAYAICSDESGRILLIRESAESGTPGVWTLPGGSVLQGEDPQDAAAREAMTETGVSLHAHTVFDVMADTRELRHRGVTLHTDRIIFSSSPASAGDGMMSMGGRGPGGDDAVRRAALYSSSPMVDAVAWMERREAATVQLRPFAAQALKLPLSAVDLPPEEMPELPGFHIVEAPDGRPTVQRFAAYGLVRDLEGRVLLTQIADGYPGAGKWHLPGGGTDFGEQPTQALLRELEEETAQLGRVRELLGVASHHEAEQVGPEGFPIDWHGVRPYYDVVVDDPRPLTVVEAGGSTQAVRWFTPDEASWLELTSVTADAFDAADLTSGIPRRRPSPRQ
ncbi:NUDIX hydrolase [Actinobacteria bacterium YIM 96077]|uniref:NUDIX hydrolase n=1 Tax=Phytoactinopolyspora halophila TaxID=1981511 RepID=A0A329R2D4_9ACTN|nr:NUDIX hydrolase [Phytoactinopolyspora halophila]AYY11952.1 NUDIX hydrolase [Actinobacteria bacterium YIM 96077]RAW18814.1 NUDIX hydrolase [Phytoactinopolyspora halophila]